MPFILRLAEGQRISLFLAVAQSEPVLDTSGEPAFFASVSYFPPFMKTLVGNAKLT